WYVADTDLELTQDVKVRDDAKLILADDKTLRFTSPGAIGEVNYDTYAALTVYGQREQSGTFDLGSIQARFNEYRVYGGVIKGQEIHADDTMLIARGTVDVQRLGVPMIGHGTISGGNVTSGATHIFSLLKSFTLSWTELTDSIHFDKVNLINYSSFEDKIKVADGKAFIDDDGNIYKGVLSDDQLRAMSGKTLTPYIETYTITIADTVNGTVTSDLLTAEEGVEITLTVAPDEHYALYSLTVTDAEDNEIELTEDYHFTMPASDVTVTAKFGYTYIIGDVDGDGEITIIDSTLIQRMDAGLEVFAFDEKAADIDGDGWSDLDAAWIRRYLAFMDIPYEIDKVVVEEPA
ncbi:MAG: dockerin type I repeat-containing protein, partial [Ruminococcus sp.]|nr:dockerin type I repeat-containing protein [Ruminococcus sp.]